MTAQTLKRVVFLLILAVPSPLVAQESAWRLALMPPEGLRLSPDERVISRRLCPDYRLLPTADEPVECRSRGFEPAAAEALAGGEASSSSFQRELPFRAKKPQPLLAALVGAGDVVGTAANSVLGYQRRAFHFTNEGFFGARTIDGGADKAAHFVDYYIVSKEFSYLFEIFGFPESDARLMAFGVATMAWAQHGQLSLNRYPRIRSISGGSDDAAGVIVVTITGVSLCVDCIARKTGVSAPRVDAMLAAIADNVKVNMGRDRCDGCLGRTMVFRIA